MTLFTVRHGLDLLSGISIRGVTRTTRADDLVNAAMDDFGGELARLMAERGLGVRELARRVPCNPGYISNLRSGRKRPGPEMADLPDKVLEAGGQLAACVRPPGCGRRGNGVHWT